MLDVIGISALGIESVAHECVAPVTKNTSIAIAPNSILGTGDQGVHGVSSGTKGCNLNSDPVGSGLEVQSDAMGSTKGCNQSNLGNFAGSSKEQANYLKSVAALGNFAGSSKEQADYLESGDPLAARRSRRIIRRQQLLTSSSIQAR
jgi:hypothetical protein